MGYVEVLNEAEDDNKTYHAQDIYPDNYSINGFVMGVIVSEGCFYISLTRDEEYRTGVRAYNAFTINMVEDDYDIVKLCMESFGGIGGSLVDKSVPDGNKPQVKWTVQSAEDCMKMSNVIREYIDAVGDSHGFVLSSKYDKFIAWEEASRIRYNGDHTTYTGAERLVELRDIVSDNTTNNSVKPGDIKDMVGSK